MRNIFIGTLLCFIFLFVGNNLSAKIFLQNSLRIESSLEKETDGSIYGILRLKEQIL
jgi:hypothetical protein